MIAWAENVRVYPDQLLAAEVNLAIDALSYFVQNSSKIHLH